VKGSVLVVTGGWLTGQEDSLLQMARKVWTQQRAAEDAWLDLAVKAVLAEPVLAARLERLLLPLRDRPLREAVRSVFADRANADAPSLTEVILCTLLHRAGLPYDRMELGDLVARPAEAERKLAAAACVFLSSTYLHDLSELEPAVRLLKRPHNRIVVGGALAGILHNAWDGMPEVDILAVGYGERLVDSLAAWIRSGGQTLEPPPGGQLVRKGPTAFLYSGVPEELSLDGLPEADWELAMQDHGRRFRMAYYESVRGCPYRCNFCNYPYLFADTKFRVKSAGRIAGDWERLAALGVEHVTCLDSLFTMPRPRLRELCRLLLDRSIRIRWICYARADDLADEETVVLMKEAGAQQVQIGIESGDPLLLDNMDKACTVEANAKALENCRRHGLTSIVSLIVGFPGETEESLERTYRFLAATPPDFYFLATFSTRVAGVPLLRPENRERFGLRVRDGLRTMSPYWEHATMSCVEVSRHVRALDRRLMRDRIALSAAVFYPALLAYDPLHHREPLLDFQQRAASGHPILTGVFDAVHGWIGRRLRRAVRECFGPGLAPPPSMGAAAPILK
jgi:anaerobic magnesium-protoporphyrin IX monomethyl ester cyclase